LPAFRFLGCTRRCVRSATPAPPATAAVRLATPGLVPRLSPDSCCARCSRAIARRSASPVHGPFSPEPCALAPIRLRARITVRSACAFALRCFTGHSNWGSIRASRARVCASRQSSFFRLSAINRTLRACATITSCPTSRSRRPTHGECIPVSNATRLCGIPANTSRRALGVVLTRRSNSTLPASSSTQYQLEQSPRSSPTVNFCCEIFSALLCPYGANLLHCRSPLSWEPTASRPETGLLIPSVYNTYPLCRINVSS
jgi:hypothetical protein